MCANFLINYFALLFRCMFSVFSSVYYLQTLPRSWFWLIEHLSAKYPYLTCTRLKKHRCQREKTNLESISKRATLQKSYIHQDQRTLATFNVTNETLFVVHFSKHERIINKQVNVKHKSLKCTHTHIKTTVAPTNSTVAFAMWPHKHV